MCQLYRTSHSHEIWAIESRRSPLAGIVWLLPVLAFIICGPLTAHDFWIEPTTFFAQPGEIVGVRLRVGQDLLGDPVPRNPMLISKFVFDHPAGRDPIPGRPGSDPAGMLRVAAPGLLILGYSSNPSAVELPADKFNEYLEEEGLDEVSALRARRGQTSIKAHELFSRCAKSLVLSAPPRRAQADRPLGFTLELVAERNPYLIQAGEDLPFRLTYENRPLAGALVVAMNRLDPSKKMKARSDKNGRVRFRLTQRGMWLVKAVHMVPAPASENADWRSFWASLTFELGTTNGVRN